MTDYSTQAKNYYILAYSPPELDISIKSISNHYIKIAIELGIFNPNTDIWLTGLRTRQHCTPKVPNLEVKGSELIERLKDQGRGDEKKAIVCLVVADFDYLEDSLIKFYMQNGFEIYREGMNIFARCEL